MVNEADTGPGVHIHIPTGNVWSEVPVVRVAVADGLSLDFYLRYDSAFAASDYPFFRGTYRNTVFGPGWTHSYNAFAVKDVSEHHSWTETELMVITGAGVRQCYKLIDGQSGRSDAALPSLSSWITAPDDETYRVHYPDGHYEDYALIGTNGVVPFYMTQIASTGAEWYRLAKFGDRRSRETLLTYDDEDTGLLVKIEDPYGRTVTLGYDEFGGETRLASITNPEGNTTTLDYEDGLLTEIQDPLLNTREYEYDGSNRITSEKLRNGTKYKVEYQDTNPKTITVKDVDTNGNPGDVVVSVRTPYPSAWNPDMCATPETVRITIDGGTVVRADGEGNEWTYQIDEYGRIMSITPPHDISDNINRTVQYTYDDDAGTFEAGSHELEGSATQKPRSRKVGDFEPTYYEYSTGYVRITAIVDPEDNLTHYQRSSTWPAFISRIADEGKLSTEYWQYDYASTNGDLLNEERFSSLCDPYFQENITHTYTYYPDGKRLQRRTATDFYGNDTEWNFNTNGTLDSVVRDPGGKAVTTTYIYDVMSRVRTRTLLREYSDDVEFEYLYDDVGRLIRKVVDSNGLALETTYAYDGEGNLTRVTDPHGVVTVYEYDRRNRLIKETVDSNGLNTVTQYEYDNADRLTKITDARNNDTVITYYDFGLAHVITDAEGYDTRLKWDALGNVARIERELTPDTNEFHDVSLTYDGLSRLTSVTVDSNGLALQTTYEYDNAGGAGCGCSGTRGLSLPKKKMDAAGKATYYKYDPLLRLTHIIQKVDDAGTNGEPDDDDVVTTYVYDDNTRVREVVNPEGEVTRSISDAAGRLSSRIVDPGGAHLETNYEYDGNGPAWTVTQPNGNITIYVYDAAGRRTGATDGIGLIDTLSYDGNGRTLTYTDGEGNVTSNGYDAAGRLISVEDPNGETETYQYDNNGNLTRVIDREDRETKYEYDDLDRLTKVIEDEAAGGLKRITEYAYDGLGNVLTLTAYQGSDGSGVSETTTYEYDDAGRLVRVVYPDNEPASSNGIARFTYYPAGTVHTRTDQKGVVTTYTYDDLHRLIGRSYSDDTPTDVFGYDRAGRLTVGSNGVAEVHFAYDNAGRLTDADLLIDGVTYASDLQFEIDTQAHTLSRTLTYPGHEVDLSETYDGRGRLDSVEYGTKALIASSAHDLADRMTERILGNGVDSTYTYNPNGWLEQIEHVKEVLTLEKLGYGYDKVGNVKYRAVETPGLERFSEIYQYDRLHRLIQFDRGVLNAERTAVVEAVPAPFVQTRAWDDLDMLGNWMSTDTTIGGDSETDIRTVNTANEYLTRQVGSAQEIDLVSDDNGNLTSNGTHIYAYDAENRLIRVTRKSDSVVLQEYAYDALGRRVRTLDLPEDEEEKVTTHVYAGSTACIAEYDSTAEEGGAEERWFAHGPGFPDPLVMVDLTDLGDKSAGIDEYLYYLKDLLGSVTALANSNGAVVERYVYDPYGGTTVLGLEGYAEAEYYHDADLDGDVDNVDSNSFDSCFGSCDVRCVFVHDRNGNNVIDVQDAGMFADCYSGSGMPPTSQQCRRPPQGCFDVNGDGVVALFDFAGFQQCFGATDDLCLLLYDVDEDEDVDLADFAEFQASLGGPGADDGYTALESGSRYGNPFAWTGQRYDAPVGLHHFPYRSYSPALGRWLQRDPLALRPRGNNSYIYQGKLLIPDIRLDDALTETGGRAGKRFLQLQLVRMHHHHKNGYQDGMNLYQYVRANPLRHTDSSGLAGDYWPECCALVGGLCKFQGYPAAYCAGLTAICAAGGENPCHTGGIIDDICWIIPGARGCEKPPPLDRLPFYPLCDIWTGFVHCNGQTCQPACVHDCQRSICTGPMSGSICAGICSSVCGYGTGPWW